MFSSRLASLRLKNKLTQQNMAEKLEMSRPAYSSYETGRTSPDVRCLNNIADILDVSVDYLLGRTDISVPESKINPEEQAQFEAFINNPEHGSFIKEYLEAPEERKQELMRTWRILKEAEQFRNLTDNQNSDNT